MRLLELFAVSRDLSCSTATPITLKLRVSYASDPLLFFKDRNVRIIAKLARRS
jgi:hypothetical protein